MTKNLRVVEQIVSLSGGHSVCHCEWFCQTGQGSVVPETHKETNNLTDYTVPSK